MLADGFDIYGHSGRSFFKISAFFRKLSETGLLFLLKKSLLFD